MTSPRRRVASRGTSSARIAAIAGLMALVVPLSGCGTRMSSAKIDAADGTAISQSAAATNSALGADTGVIAPTTGDTTTTGALPVGATGRVTGTTATAATGAGTTGAGTTATGTARTGVAGAASGPSGTTNQATASNSANAAGTGSPGTGANAPCPSTLAPVVIGQTLPSSGIIGATVANLRAGMALWARAVNAAGGVQCHPVQLYQMDDAADPARVTSNLNDLVNNKKAIAIVGAGVPTTLAAAKRFAEQNKVPMVGGDLIEAGWFSSPYLFPQGGSALAAYAGATKEAALKANTKKVGLVYCVEATICGTINDNFLGMAKAAGLDVVLRKVSSITSPDYTAECQALKSAGAQAIFVALESSGNERFARSCVSLGYTPPTGTAALAVSAEAAQDPNLRKVGIFLGSGVAPYLATDTPAGKEFTSAYDRFAAGSPLDQNTLTGYSAGKLFEQALANVFSKARTGPITRELLFEGLWQVKNETLDGLAPGITFNKNAPPSQNDCYALLVIGSGGYAAPKGSKFECFKGLPRGF